MSNLLDSILGKPRSAATLISELRKDCIYIIMLPADQRQEFIQALESIDLTNGPEILVVDEMPITIMEFSKGDRRTNTLKPGKK